MTKHEEVQRKIIRDLIEMNKATEADTLIDLIVDHAKSHYYLTARELLLGIENLDCNSKEISPGFWDWMLDLDELVIRIAQNHHWSDQKEGANSFEIYPSEWLVIDDPEILKQPPFKTKMEEMK